MIFLDYVSVFAFSRGKMEWSAALIIFLGK